MKKIIKIVIISSVACLVLLVLFIGIFVLRSDTKTSKRHFWRGPLMSMEKVCANWGEAPLDIDQFKAVGDREDLFYSEIRLLTDEEKANLNPPPSAEKLRAKMACSLLKNQEKFYGKDTREIRKIFGNFTGHYFTDRIPTYIIGKISERDENSWQLVFFIDRNAKIVEIVVHQNCCDD